MGDLGVGGRGPEHLERLVRDVEVVLCMSTLIAGAGAQVCKCQQQQSETYVAVVLCASLQPWSLPPETESSPPG